MAKLILALLTAALLFPFAAPSAEAQQLARTFVSAANGNDINNCDRLTPCRTFQRAHDQTLPNGEITVLDPGGYGTLTISKAISIINDGVGEAGILVSGGAEAIAVFAGATDAVSLRGITINGIGFGGGYGIFFRSGLSLTVENCVVRNLGGTVPAGQGINFTPLNSSSLVVSNTLVADNHFGIEVQPFNEGLTVTAVLKRVEMYNNSFDNLSVASSQTSGTVRATVVESVATNCQNSGFVVSGSAGAASASLMLIRSVASGNGVGIQTSQGNATLRVSQSLIIGNTSAWAQPGGTLRSYGDNYIELGQTQVFPSIIAKK
jgi:hypothetical protein